MRVVREITQPRILEIYLACKAVQMVDSRHIDTEEPGGFFEYLQFALDPYFIKFNPLKDKDFLKEYSNTIGYLCDYVCPFKWPLEVCDDIEISQFVLDDMDIDRDWVVSSGVYPPNKEDI